ncbi:MAG: molybdopterin cofactor-binding domain-containing protein [Roseovarius sp.]
MPRLLSRRTFLLTGATLGGTALVAGVAGATYLSSVDVDGLTASVDGDSATLNAFVVIEADGRVTVNVPKTEMGQGIHTGLAMVVAEELDIPFDDRISVVFPTDPLPAYSNWFNALQIRPEEASGPVVWIARRVLGQMGFVATGASGSTMGMWHPMRVAGASAREMLIAAAAARLDVEPETLRTKEGYVVSDEAGSRFSYGELAREAALMTPPQNPTLKPASDWRIVGRSQQRVDLPAKVTGKPVFGMDVIRPDMVHAAIRHAPVFGAQIERILNKDAVKNAPGVLEVVPIGLNRVAVVGVSWWQAEQACSILEVEWSSTAYHSIGTEDLTADLLAALESDEPHEHLSEGDVEENIAANGERIVEASYEVPFAAHACMEPINATVLVNEDGSAEAWVPTQNPMFSRRAMARAAEMAGIDLSEITFNVTMSGGAFGRRSDGDVVMEATYLAARMRGRPVKVIWSREEDISRGLYRTHGAGRLRASLGEDGLPTALDAIVAGKSPIDSIAARNLPLNPGPEGDILMLEGIDKPFYAIPARRIRSQHVPGHMPVHFWRSNGYSSNTFFSESFTDECAVAAGADPLAYRRALLRDSPRHLAVLDRVAEMAGWDTPLEPGRGRGIAIEECYRSVVAQVAEVTVRDDGEVTVDRVFCALDAGLIINPDAVVAQMEGGIIFGTTTALMSEITLRDGQVQQSNFHDFPVQRIANAPEIEVFLIQSNGAPCGVGEPGVVPVAAAIANAIFAATGQRLRKLPLATTEYTDVRRTRSMLRPA